MPGSHFWKQKITAQTGFRHHHNTMCDFHNFGLIFAGQMHCLPQRLKSTLVEIFSNGGCQKGAQSVEKNSNNVDFSLWGNRATTQTLIYLKLDIFLRVLAYCVMCLNSSRWPESDFNYPYQKKSNQNIWLIFPFHSWLQNFYLKVLEVTSCP